MNKKYRLKKTFEIEKLFQRRQSVGNQFYVIYFKFSSNKNPRVAFSVSKKLGNAVLRNKEKRVLREIVRKHINMINNCDLLIVEKKSAIDLEFAIKEKEIINLFGKIHKRRSM